MASDLFEKNSMITLDNKKNFCYAYCTFLGVAKWILNAEFKNTIYFFLSRIAPSYTMCTIVHMQTNWVLSNSAKQLLAW